MSRKIDFRGMPPNHVVEAALFAAGKPIGVQEIMDETGLGKRAVDKALQEVAAEYKDRDTVLEVSKAGTKWAMQVRRQAAEPAARFAPMEIASKLLKTLALIAYHQPVKQSDLKDMIGSKVYDHVGELKDRGLIKTRRDGITKIITTTAAFPEYFGLEAASNDEVRVKMAELVGLPPPDKRPKDRGLDSFPPTAAESPPPEATDAAAAATAESGPEAPPEAEVAP